MNAIIALDMRPITPAAQLWKPCTGAAQCGSRTEYKSIARRFRNLSRCSLGWPWWKFLSFLALLLLVVPAFAATENGFVTYINSSTEFDVGTTHVVVNAQTNCEAKTLPVLKMSYHPIYTLFNSPHYPSPSLSLDTKAIRIASIACDARQMPIGSRIHLVGFRQLGGQFMANSVVIYAEAPNKITVSGALLEETPELRHNARGWNGTLWLDGYPMVVSNQTKLLTAPASTIFNFRWHLGTC